MRSKKKLLLSLIGDQNRPRLWLAFGLVVGIALQNKCSIAFFVVALGIGLLLTPARKRLWSIWLLAGAGLALLIYLSGAPRFQRLRDTAFGLTS